MTSSIPLSESNNELLHIIVKANDLNLNNKTKIIDNSKVGLFSQISCMVENILDTLILTVIAFFGGVFMNLGSIGLSIGIIIGLCITAVISLLLLPLKIIQAMINTCCHKNNQISSSAKESKSQKKNLMLL